MPRELTKACPRCQGTGEFITFEDSATVTKVECPECSGSGVRAHIVLDLTDVLDKLNDITDKVNDVMDKCDDIFEKVKRRHSPKGK